MQENKSSLITIRVSQAEKSKFYLLSALENKPISQLVKDLVNREINDKELSATDIRKLPKELRGELIIKMTESALPYYEKNKSELELPEIEDGIE